MFSGLRKHIDYSAPIWGKFSFISPNGWTLLGLISSGLAGWFFHSGEPVRAALAVALAGVFDTIDGGVARFTGKKTRFGAIFDASLDRLGEGMIYAGLAGRYPQAVWALVFSYMVSYVRAKDDSIRVGVAERGERLALLVAFALAGWLSWGLWAIAGLAAVSFLMRLDYARNHL